MSYMAGSIDGLIRAKQSLDGLSIGDAFGQRFFSAPAELIARRELPPGPWPWTDDTAQALAIWETLQREGEIRADLLASLLAQAYRADPGRGYGGGAHELLTAINAGKPWRTAAQALFGGQGSMGNGAAMRAAPVGAYFADQIPEAIVQQALASAAPTHAHPEGAAGAVAVALAASFAWNHARGRMVTGQHLLTLVAGHTPHGLTRTRLGAAMNVDMVTTTPKRAAELLGNGSHVLAQDTVAFAIWCAARHLGDFESCMWSTVSGGGDIDTTCAIAGGIVALSCGPLPKAWLKAREPLAWPIPTR